MSVERSGLVKFRGADVTVIGPDIQVGQGKGSNHKKTWSPEPCLHISSIWPNWLIVSFFDSSHFRFVDTICVFSFLG